MKKISVLLLSILCSCFSSFAQFKTTAAGPGFDEPEDGYAKILQEKNGSTCFVHITLKDGINVITYDENHKQTVVKNITPAYGKLRVGKGQGAMQGIQGLYEINKNIVLFLSEYDGSKPSLYRLIIDGKTGNLIEEKTIGTLNDLRFKDGYAVLFGKVPPPAFYVRKDPESDNYAVALFNSFASDRNERIELVHYNKDNQEISRAFYQSPDNGYKYLNFMDLCVRGDKEVIALAVGMNTRSSGGDLNGTLLMGSLKAGSKSFDLQKLAFPDAGKIEEAMIRYNKTKDAYVILSVKPIKSDEYKVYKTDIKSVGAEAVTNMVSSASINRIASKHYDKKDQFLAIPQILYMNDDGSYSIVFEENKRTSYTTYSTPNASGMGMTMGHTVVKDYLEDIGIIEYNADGTEKNAYYIPKSQQVREIPRAIYYSFRDETGVRLYYGNQFKSFYFFNGKNKRYVFINDIAKNQDRIDDAKKVTTIQGLDDCEAYAFEIGDEGSMPKRKLLFDEKGSKKEKDMALFAISDFDRNSNTFVTLKLEHIKGNKEVKLVWMQPN